MNQRFIEDSFFNYCRS